MMEWIVSDGISIRKTTLDLGFAIEHLNKFEEQQRNIFKKDIVLSIVRDLDDAWDDESSSKFRDVTQGVYVLCLDGKLCVRYNKGLSKVLYIGKGAIRQRINSHLKQKLLDFFLDLPGINFRFYLCEAKKQKFNNYFEHLESDLLKDFTKKYGEKPLFNKNSGVNHRVRHNHKSGWNMPLKNVKAGYTWALSSAESRTGSPKLDS